MQQFQILEYANAEHLKMELIFSISKRLDLEPQYRVFKKYTHVL
jgi:hypothetical protein